MTEHTAAEVVCSEFRSGNLDEIRRHTARYGEAHRITHGGGPYVYTESIAATGRVMIGRMARTFRQTLRAAVMHPTLFIDLRGGDSVRLGRRSYQPDADLAVINAQGQEYVRHGGATAGFGLRVESNLLESQIAARVRGRSRRWHVQSVPLHLAAERRRELLAFEAVLRAAARPGGDWGAFGSRIFFEETVAGWLADLVLDHAGVKSTTHATAHRLLQLQEWVDAHLAEDISLQTLSDVARLSGRSLQKAMLTAHGQSPLQFLNARRLNTARRILQSGAPRLRVATVALDCGFRHLGRFSGSYKRAFGEAPLETLMNSRAGNVD